MEVSNRVVMLEKFSPNNAHPCNERRNFQGFSLKTDCRLKNKTKCTVGGWSNQSKKDYAHVKSDHFPKVQGKISPTVFEFSPPGSKETISYLTLTCSIFFWRETPWYPSLTLTIFLETRLPSLKLIVRSWTQAEIQKKIWSEPTIHFQGQTCC